MIARTTLAMTSWLPTPGPNEVFMSKRNRYAEGRALAVTLKIPDYQLTDNFLRRLQAAARYTRNKGLSPLAALDRIYAEHPYNRALRARAIYDQVQRDCARMHTNRITQGLANFQ